ncbi:hypothetical protein QZH41_014851 [Actinostola sp. cb2023]|nr:hypothetical protein QZH41_014851 [Actinostola sp. cb2023]
MFPSQRTLPLDQTNMASKLLLSLSRTQKRFLQFGVPMLVLVVAGSFGLKEFTDIKIKRRDSKFHKVRNIPYCNHSYHTVAIVTIL